jgi:hypothetical protein
MSVSNRENLADRIAVTIAAGSAPSSFSNHELLHGNVHRRALLVGRGIAALSGGRVNQRLAAAIASQRPDLGVVNPRPIGHGCEAVVYGASPCIDAPMSQVIKVPLPKLGESAEASVERMQGYVDTYSRFLGDMAVATEILTVDSPFSGGRIAIVSQPKVEGSCLLRGDVSAKPERRIDFGYGVREMLDETGMLPDMAGPGNVLVTSDGHPILVDLGRPVTPDRDDFAGNLAILHSIERDEPSLLCQ